MNCMCSLQRLLSKVTLSVVEVCYKPSKQVIYIHTSTTHSVTILNNFYKLNTFRSDTIY